MLKILRTNSDHPGFSDLVKELDADLAVRDGKEHSFYAQYNTIDAIRYVVLAIEHGKALGCGAIKEFGPGIMEIKRMFVSPESRKKGIASRILSELESWAREHNCKKCILETGKRQPEAIGLYTRSGYTPLPNYGQYAGIENSVCFEKVL